MEWAAELLLRTDKKIIQIAEEVGYHDMDYFVNRFIQVKAAHRRVSDARCKVENNIYYCKTG